MTIDQVSITVLFAISTFLSLRTIYLNDKVEDLRIQVNVLHEAWVKQLKYNALLDKCIGRVEDRTR